MQKTAQTANATGPSISSWEVERLSVIAQREAGISLGQDKIDFLLSRLSRRLSSLNIGSFRAYCDLLDRPEGKSELKVFVESITTHTTSFFRESTQFDWLRSTGLKLLYERGAGRERPLVIWSAACSIGAELYSAMMTAQSAGKELAPSYRVKGIGTDLSRQVVRVAENAVYSRQEIQGVPQDLRHEFLLSSKSDKDKFRLSANLRNNSEWRVANLNEIATLTGIDADIVFLRNVLIYFDTETQNRVLNNVLSRLRRGGILMVGHSETGTVRDHNLTTIRPTIYQKSTG